MFGIDLSTLEDKDLIGIKKVPGRVAQIDADFIAYQAGFCGAETYSEQQKACDDIIGRLVKLAGAEQYHLHLTPTGSNKGGRNDQAMYQPYQETRTGRDKPEHLDDLRQWMGSRTNATLYSTMEADDGMCIAQNKAIDAGHSEQSIICSKDKDLRMVSGWHLDWDTGKHELVYGYGYIKLDDSKSTKTVKGFGTSFFWAQLLMGDTADNIKGLPNVTGAVLNAIKPTAAISKAIEVVRDKQSTDRQVASAQAKLAARKPAACGTVMAYDIISKCKDDKQAYQTVRHLYQLYNEAFKPVNYRDNKPLSWQEHMMSEMRMLWMRRTIDRNDVITFLKERVL